MDARVVMILLAWPPVMVDGIVAPPLQMDGMVFG